MNDAIKKALRAVGRPVWFALPARTRALVRGRMNPPAYPKTIQIEHTARCNLKCVMCPHGYDPPEKQEDMDLKFFEDLIMQIPGLEKVFLQGLGEPMLHKQVLPMIRFANERGIKTGFICNMTVMTEKMAEELVLAGHEMVGVSMESIDAEVLANIRRGAKYDLLPRILENIKRVKDARDRHGRDLPRIHVNSILMKHTIDRIPELVRTLKEAGVNSISFANLYADEIDPEERLPNGDLMRDEPVDRLPQERIRELVDTIHSLNGDGIELTIPANLEHEGGPSAPLPGIRTCPDLWEQPFVNADGRLKPCCYALTTDDLLMGNLHEQSFDEIFFGDNFNKLRRQHLTGHPPEMCAKCHRLSYVTEPPSIFKGRRDTGYRYTKIFLGGPPARNGKAG